jgi:hypothetical protein
MFQIPNFLDFYYKYIFLLSINDKLFKQMLPILIQENIYLKLNVSKWENYY